MDRPRFPTPESAETVEEFRGEHLRCRVNVSPEWPAVLSFHCATSRLGMTVLVPNDDLAELRDMLARALDGLAAEAPANG